MNKISGTIVNYDSTYQAEIEFDKSINKIN